MPLGLALLSAAFPPERRGDGDRRLQRDHRASRSPAARSSAARSPRASAGSGSSGSTCRSGSSRSRSCCAGCPRATARTRALDLPGLALVTGARARRRLGPRARQRAGWGAPRWSARWPPGSLLVAAFVAWELRAPRADAAAALFRSRAFSAGNAAIFLLVRVALRRRLLHRAVPADGARLRPARRRPAAAAVDGDAVSSSRPSRARWPTAIGERPFLVGGLAAAGRRAWPGSR